MIKAKAPAPAAKAARKDCGEGSASCREELLHWKVPIYDALKPVFDQLSGGASIDDVGLDTAMVDGMGKAIYLAYHDEDGPANIPEIVELSAIFNPAMQESAQLFAQEYVKTNWFALILNSSKTKRGDWSEQRLLNIAITEGTHAQSAASQLFRKVLEEVQELCLGS